MKQAYLDLIERLHEVHVELIEMLANFPKLALIPSELADAMYVHKTATEKFNELRLMMGRETEKLEKMLLLAMSTLESDKISTGWCSATLQTRLCTSVPTLKKDPELYFRFCREVLGVTDEGVLESGLINIHYPAWIAYHTNLMEQAKELPKELMDSLTSYDESRISIRSRKNLLEKDDNHGEEKSDD